MPVGPLLESRRRAKGLMLTLIWLRLNLSKTDREPLKLHSTWLPARGSVQQDSRLHGPPSRVSAEDSRFEGGPCSLESLTFGEGGARRGESPGTRVDAPAG